MHVTTRSSMGKYGGLFTGGIVVNITVLHFVFMIITLNYFIRASHTHNIFIDYQQVTGLGIFQITAQGLQCAVLMENRANQNVPQTTEQTAFGESLLSKKIWRFYPSKSYQQNPYKLTALVGQQMMVLTLAIGQVVNQVILYFCNY